jgi:hypothetical protein
MSQYIKVEKCRVCGNSNLIPTFDIGEQYLSSVFPESLDYRKTLKKYPLDMVLCKKEGHEQCGLLQLGHDLDLSEMYAAYPYTSSSNSAMKGILKDVADSGIVLGHLQTDDTILDIGANDGTLLSFFHNQPYNLVGIDAAQNVKHVFESARFRFARGYFNQETYDKLTDKKAKLIFSIAMFYHLSDPIAFCRDVAACMENEGVWIVQMAYLPAMLKTNMYDNIVHEHNGYYGIETMQWIMGRVGLEIFDVQLNDVYGGSFRLFIKKKNAKCFSTTQRLLDCLAKEQEAKIFDLKTYQAFDQRIQKTRANLKDLLLGIKKQGKTVWVYGASTKGNTILQYCALTSHDIVAAADANPFKFGKFIIGIDVPIQTEEAMRKAKPDYLLSLPYSFTDAFIKREECLVKEGTRFIVPLPEVQIRP